MQEQPSREGAWTSIAGISLQVSKSRFIMKGITNKSSESNNKFHAVQVQLTCQCSRQQLGLRYLTKSNFPITSFLSKLKLSGLLAKTQVPCMVNVQTCHSQRSERSCLQHPQLALLVGENRHQHSSKVVLRGCHNVGQKLCLSRLGCALQR